MNIELPNEDLLYKAKELGFDGSNHPITHAESPALALLAACKDVKSKLDLVKAAKGKLVPKVGSVATLRERDLQVLCDRMNIANSKLPELIAEHDKTRKILRGAIDKRHSYWTVEGLLRGKANCVWHDELFEAASALWVAVINCNRQLVQQNLNLRAVKMRITAGEFTQHTAVEDLYLTLPGQSREFTVQIANYGQDATFPHLTAIGVPLMTYHEARELAQEGTAHFYLDYKPGWTAVYHVPTRKTGDVFHPPGAR